MEIALLVTLAIGLILGAVATVQLVIQIAELRRKVELLKEWHQENQASRFVLRAKIEAIEYRLDHADDPDI